MTFRTKRSWLRFLKLKSFFFRNWIKKNINEKEVQPEWLYNMYSYDMYVWWRVWHQRYTHIDHAIVCITFMRVSRFVYSNSQTVFTNKRITHFKTIMERDILFVLKYLQTEIFYTVSEWNEKIKNTALNRSNKILRRYYNIYIIHIYLYIYIKPWPLALER